MDVLALFNWYLAEVSIRCLCEDPHLASERECRNWLTPVYMVYFAVARLLDFDADFGLLPEIHRRVATPVGVGV